MKQAVALAGLLFSISPLHAICTLDLAVVGDGTKSPKLTWNAVTGAAAYEVEESRDGFVTTRKYAIKSSTPFFDVPRRATEETRFAYIVSAVPQMGALALVTPAPLCSERVDVIVGRDSELRAAARRAVIPIAGSVEGANNGRFRTSLRLTSTAGGQRGKLVFHPAGVAASPSDPSVPYSFAGLGQSIAIDDVSEAFHRDGLGTIDVIPDDDSASSFPAVQVHLYAEAERGRYGTFSTAVPVYDYLTAPTMSVEVPPASMRLNLGLRTLTELSVDVLTYDSTHRLKGLKTLTFPADTLVFASAAQLLGTSLAPGESISLNFHGGVVPFYTLTDNGTNDPSLVIGRGGEGAAASYVE